MSAYPPSCVWLFATPWIVAHQVPLSLGFSKQEYWNGLPCPPQYLSIFSNKSMFFYLLSPLKPHFRDHPIPFLPSGLSSTPGVHDSEVNWYWETWYQSHFFTIFKAIFLGAFSLDLKMEKPVEYYPSITHHRIASLLHIINNLFI